MEPALEGKGARVLPLCTCGRWPHRAGGSLSPCRRRQAPQEHGSGGQSIPHNACAAQMEAGALCPGDTKGKGKRENKSALEEQLYLCL